MLYEHLCHDCSIVTTVNRPMARRNDPYTCQCGGGTERIPSLPYITPESMWAEGTIASKGRKVKINDCDDPWEGVDGLSAEQSEEFVAKSKELKGQRAANWGDRRNTIVFDTGK